MKDGIKFILVVISMMFSITGQFEWGFYILVMLILIKLEEIEIKLK